MIDCIVKWRKETISEKFRCSEIIWSAGKVIRLATHKLVDQEKMERKKTTKVIFEPIGLNDFKSSHHAHHLVASWASHSLLQRKGKKVGDGCQREKGQNILRLIITGWLGVSEVESSAYKLACSLVFCENSFGTKFKYSNITAYFEPNPRLIMGISLGPVFSLPPLKGLSVRQILSLTISTVR